MGVKDEPPAKRRIRLGKLWWWMVAVFVGVIGWQMRELHLYNAAVREAEEAGFEWEEGANSWALIRQDWHNLWKKETWAKRESILSLGKVLDFTPHHSLIHRLHPTLIDAQGFTALQNVDALKGLTTLQALCL